MQEPRRGEPLIYKHQPMHTIRYTTFGQKELYHSTIIPQVHVKNAATGQLVRKEFGSSGLAMGHWNTIVASGLSHLEEPVASAELLYGGDLVTNNTVVVGAEILRTWTPEKGEIILLDPPEVSHYQADPVVEEAIDVTVDPAAATPAPEESNDTSHIALPGAPRHSMGAVNGSPQIPPVLIPIASGEKIGTIPQPDPSVVTEIHGAAPTDPAPSEAAPTDPAPSEAAPTDPAPSDATPAPEEGSDTPVNDTPVSEAATETN